MRTPHTLTALQLLEDLLPYCREHGGKLFSCEVLSDTLSTIEDQAIEAYFERVEAERRNGVRDRR